MPHILRFFLALLAFLSFPVSAQHVSTPESPLLYVPEHFISPVEIGDGRSVCTGCNTPAIVTNGDGFLVGWADYTRTLVMPLNSHGVPSLAFPVEADGSYNFGARVHLVALGEGYGLLTIADGHVVLVGISDKGKPTGERWNLMPAQYPYRLAVAQHGDSILVVQQSDGMDAALHATIINRDGVLIGSSRVTSLRTDGVEFDARWDGSGFVVAWSDYVGSSATEVFVRKLNAACNSITGTKSIGRVESVTNLSLASNGQTTLVGFISNGLLQTSMLTQDLRVLATTDSKDARTLVIVSDGWQYKLLYSNAAGKWVETRSAVGERLDNRKRPQTRRDDGHVVAGAWNGTRVVALTSTDGGMRGGQLFTHVVSSDDSTANQITRAVVAQNSFDAVMTPRGAVVAWTEVDPVTNSRVVKLSRPGHESRSLADLAGREDPRFAGSRVAIAATDDLLLLTWTHWESDVSRLYALRLSHDLEVLDDAPRMIGTYSSSLPPPVLWVSGKFAVVLPTEYSLRIVFVTKSGDVTTAPIFQRRGGTVSAAVAEDQIAVVWDEPDQSCLGCDVYPRLVRLMMFNSDGAVAKEPVVVANGTYPTIGASPDRLLLLHDDEKTSFHPQYSMLRFDGTVERSGPLSGQYYGAPVFANGRFFMAPFGRVSELDTQTGAIQELLRVGGNGGVYGLKFLFAERLTLVYAKQFSAEPFLGVPRVMYRVVDLP